MCHALQRRLDRIFPQGNETAWMDCRQVVSQCALSFSVAVIGLNYIAAWNKKGCLPAQTLVLDMNCGASMEDVIRFGADGLLCSSLLTLEQLVVLARQCRTWNYPFIADCRKAHPQTIQTFLTLGAHAALLDEEQLHHAPFRHCLTRFVPCKPDLFSSEKYAGGHHEY